MWMTDHGCFWIIDYVNDPAVIKRKSKWLPLMRHWWIAPAVALTALEITRYGGGGPDQLWVHAGRGLKRGGKPVVAVRGRANKGVPRIVLPMLQPRARRCYRAVPCALCCCRIWRRVSARKKFPPAGQGAYRNYAPSRRPGVFSEKCFERFKKSFSLI